MKKVLPNYNKNAQVLYVHTVLFQFLDIRFWQVENKIHIFMLNTTTNNDKKMITAIINYFIILGIKTSFNFYSM